ncbi:MAG: UbiA family prenyltransferase [Desulfobacterales bacterium]
MDPSTPQAAFRGWSRLNLFWALSRTPHGLLDMCTPPFAALLWLGEVPPAAVAGIGLVTTFAGYTAVYALNDLVDFRLDREKAQDAGGFVRDGADLDGRIVRHPLAQGLLPWSHGLAWTVFWSLVALGGAFLLNPVCVWIFLGGFLFEALYCRLFRVTPLRALVSGAVKTTGAIAAVFAVDPDPAGGFLLILFAAVFAWEIGGQNIPNDIADLEEDRRLGARTLPVALGAHGAARLAAFLLAAAAALTAAAFAIGRGPFPGGFALLSLAGSCYLWARPAARLKRRPDRGSALALFNRASLYPPLQLAIVAAAILWNRWIP